MLEKLEERRLMAKVARYLNINYRTALIWWNQYKETEEIPYKKSEENSGPKSSFTTKHNEYLRGLLNNDPQLFSDDIMKSLTKQFEDFTISKSQLSNQLCNTMLISINNQRQMKRDRLLAEDNLSARIADVCTDVLISDLYGFCNHSKHQIIKYYKKTSF